MTENSGWLGKGWATEDAIGDVEHAVFTCYVRYEESDLMNKQRNVV